MTRKPGLFATSPADLALDRLRALTPLALGFGLALAWAAVFAQGVAR